MLETENLVKPSLLTRTKNLITNNAKPAAAIAVVGVVVYVVANKFLGETETDEETVIDI